MPRTSRRPGPPRPRLGLAHGALLSLLGLSTGCSIPQPDHWTDQLQADGPCWRVNLLDGLDETSTDELHDLYGCISARGAFLPLGPVVDSLDSPSRDGVPLGIELAVLVNDLPAIDVDPWKLADAGIELMQAEGRPVEPLLELVVELLYGRPYAQVVASVDLDAQAELDQGVIRPLLPLLGRSATVVLDQGDTLPDLLSQVIGDPAVDDMACTLAGLQRSPDPQVSGLAASLLPDLGDALLRVTDTSNDRWSGTSGNSLRDLVDLLLLDRSTDGQTLLSAMQPDLLAIIDDPLVVANLRETLATAQDRDQLAVLPAQLEYLASVDVQGGDLSLGEDSALASLLRLLDSANTDVSCSIDIIVTQLDFDLGNLSVALLSLLADQDPEAAADGIDLLGDLLGWGLTESTLDFIADTGVCPVIDHQLIADLPAIDRLNDPVMGELLENLLRVLDDLRDGQEDRLVPLVDLVSTVVQRGAVPPLEGAVHDLGSTALASDLVVMLGLLLDPAALQVAECPTGSRPLDLEGLLGLVHAAVADRPGGAPLDALQPVLEPLLGDDATWAALDHLGALARADSRVRDLPELLVTLMAVDPDLVLTRDLAALLADPALHGPTLRLAESSSLLDSLGAAPADQPGPLPWLAGLVVDGTIQTLLRTLDLVLDGLTGSSQSGATARTADPIPRK